MRPASAWTPSGPTTKKGGSRSIASSMPSPSSRRSELLAAGDDAERMAIRERHVDLLKEIENREKAELQVGRGTVADVAEAAQRRQQAEFDLRTAREGFRPVRCQGARAAQAARQRYEAQAAYYKEGRITLDRFADASHQLAEAELRTAKSDFERIAIKKRHLDRLKEIEEREKTELKDGRSTTVRRVGSNHATHRGGAGPARGRQHQGRDGSRLTRSSADWASWSGRSSSFRRSGARPSRPRDQPAGIDRPSIRPYGRRIDSFTSRWNSSRSLSWPEGRSGSS